MNKKIRTFITMIIVIILVVSLSGCEDNNTDKGYSGVYTGEFRKLVGDSDEDKDTSPFTITLKDDGTGSFNRDGSDFVITKWSVKENKFTMKESCLGETNEYTGTLDGNTLTFYDGDITNELTNMYVSKKK